MGKEECSEVGWGLFKIYIYLFIAALGHPTPVLLPGKPHGWRSLVGYSPWGRWGSDTTERLHFHFSLSCIGEGNGNPLPCSCLENPRDGGAWWAAVYGVAQSRTRLSDLAAAAVLGHCYCAWVFSSCGEWGLLSSCVGFSLQWLLLLQRMALWLVGYSSCPVACGIFLDQVWNQCPLHCKGDS